MYDKRKIKLSVCNRGMLICKIGSNVKKRDSSILSLGKLCFPKQNLHFWLIDCNFRNFSGLDSPQHN